MIGLSSADGPSSPVRSATVWVSAEATANATPDALALNRLRMTGRRENRAATISAATVTVAAMARIIASRPRGLRRR
ncbi:hypothetical protein ACFQ1L_21455 [Phytohabitans flavus]|uniref:hypothetical protein n=1 Tax=Phytohabitans flavus TaxID=1076124 RepID=UPI00363FE15F